MPQVVHIKQDNCKIKDGANQKKIVVKMRHAP